MIIIFCLREYNASFMHTKRNDLQPNFDVKKRYKLLTLFHCYEFREGAQIKSLRPIGFIHQVMWKSILTRHAARSAWHVPCPAFPVFFLILSAGYCKKAYVTHAIAALFNPLRPGYSPHKGKKPKNRSETDPLRIDLFRSKTLYR